MATQTRALGSVSDSQVPPHYAALEIEYDDATLLLTAVRVINETNRTARVTAGKADGTRTQTRDVAAGQTVTQAIPTNQANRLELTVTPSGKLDGVQYSFYLL